MLYIQSYAHISSKGAYQNGKPFLSIDDIGAEQFLKNCYQKLSIDYPKFYKMDELCKLAFIAGELVMNQLSATAITNHETAIVLANASSTHLTDSRHAESIADTNDYFPSPAVFVYTLPNITIGEIAIRHKLQGENTFFVAEQYNPAFMHQYTEMLVASGAAKNFLSGWVDFSANDFKAFLYFAGMEVTDHSLPHTKENLSDLYDFFI